MAPFCVRVDDALVKHQTVFLVLGREFHFFQCLVSVKVIGVPDGDGVSGFPLFQGGQDMLLHACIIQFFSSTDIEGKPSNFAAVFAPDGAVPVIFGTAGDKLFNGIAVQFVGHLPKEISRLYLTLTILPCVYDTVCIIIQHLFLQTVEVTV